MDKTKFVALVIAVLLLLVLPYGASGEVTTPYIEIEYPRDGQTVGERTELVVVAEGYDLRNPFVSIEGEHGIAVGFPLEGCIYSAPGVTDLEGTDLTTIPQPPGPMKMYCKTEIDLGSFQGERIRLSVSVLENSEIVMDSVGLFVSGQCV